MYELQDSPGKGKGLFASAAGIRQGDLVISEAPIFSLDSASFKLPQARLERHLVGKLQTLDAGRRAEFMCLSTNGADDQYPLASRFLTNALGTTASDGDDEDNSDDNGERNYHDDHQHPDGNHDQQQRHQQQRRRRRRRQHQRHTAAVPAVFRNASRLNHSCIPNCHYVWDEAAGRCLVHTTTDVPPGHELTVAYDSRGTVQSTMEMEAAMGFRCACSRCSLPPEEVEGSDARRREMNDILAWLQAAYRAADPQSETSGEEQPPTTMTTEEDNDEDDYGSGGDDGGVSKQSPLPPPSFSLARVLPLCQRFVELQRLEFDAALTYNLGLTMHYASSCCFLHGDYMRASVFAARALVVFTVCEGADGQNARTYRDLMRDFATTIRSKKPLAGNQQAYDRWLWSTD